MFSFTKNRFIFYTIALFLLVFSAIAPTIFGLNQGIDMTGGIQIEYTVDGGSTDDAVQISKNTVIQEAYDLLSPEEKKIITDTTTYGVNGTNHFIIEAGIDESSVKHDDKVDFSQIEKTKETFLHNLQDAFNKQEKLSIQQTRYVNIGASFGSYIKNSGYLTLSLAVIAISIYIMWAFWGSIPGVASWPFAVVTGLSLFHDVVVAFGLYVCTSFFFPEFKIDTFFITAMLTILGYSINDTIVIMDRVRTTLRESKGKNLSLAEVIDHAIHSTMRRSLLTSLTIVVVLVAMFALGPNAIRNFTLALIFGTVIGTYSSVFLAAPMLLDIYGKKERAQKKKNKDTDKSSSKK